MLTFIDPPSIPTQDEQDEAGAVAVAEPVAAVDKSAPEVDAEESFTISTDDLFKL